MDSIGKRLAKAVSRLVEPIQFRFVAKRNTFIQKTAWGFNEFLWTTHPTISSDSIMSEKYSLVFGVRHEAVESVVNQLNLVHGDDNKKYTTTVSCPLELFPISSKRHYSYVVANGAHEKDVENVAKEIAAVVANDGLPFYEHYSTLSACAADLNTNLRSRSHKLLNNLERRMYYAVAAAYLAEQKDCASLVEQWREVCADVLPQNIRLKAQNNLTALIGILGAHKNAP